MTKQNPWTLVPQYDKKGGFTGYALRKPNKEWEKDAKTGKPVLIKPDSKNWQWNSVEEKGCTIYYNPEGCPISFNLEGCTISYNGASWKITEEQLWKHMLDMPIKYKPTQDKNGRFTGYDVEQDGKFCGHLDPTSVTYDKGSVFWKDDKGRKYFIEKLSPEKAKGRTGTATQTLSKCGERITDDVRIITQNLFTGDDAYMHMMYNSEVQTLR